jgi:hypothetical protein
LKKILLFLVFFSSLFAKDIELKLFEQLFSSLFNKKTIYVYTSPKFDKIFKESKVLIPVKECKKADIVFGVLKKCNKPIFVLNYYVYKSNPDVLGAFYWRKGRPQLRLRKKIILKYNLHIDKTFEDFLE